MYSTLSLKVSEKENEEHEEGDYKVVMNKENICENTNGKK